MPSLNIDLNFFEHPKLKRLRGLLNPNAEAYLIRLWAHVGKFHPEDGILKNFSKLEIEGIAGWDGEKNKMLEAFLKTGFIEKVGKWYEIHDWREHEGHLLVFKERAKLAAEGRWGNRINKDKSDKNASSTPKGGSKQCPYIAVHSIAVQSNTNKQAQAPFIPPEWMDLPTWFAYLEIRKAKRAAKTNYALELIISDLKKFKDQGHNPKTILENSIKGGWAAVFPPRQDFKGTAPSACPPIPGKYDGIGEKV